MKARIKILTMKRYQKKKKTESMSHNSYYEKIPKQKNKN